LLIAGIFLVKALTRDLFFFSMLIVSVITLASFIVKIFFNPDFLTEFVIAGAVSAIIAAMLHFVSLRIGAYDTLSKLDYRNER
jgi:hypothetical protein